MNRRHILKLTGGGFIVSAAALAGFSMTREPSLALAPWHNAGDYADNRLYALSYAILAPNPHNRQPWQIELIGDDKIRIYRDLVRNLPHTDPFERQLTIGMGCFLEGLNLALGSRGLTSEIDLFPSANEGFVAEVRVMEANLSSQTGALAQTTEAVAQDKSLFGSILGRRSCKESFLDKAVASEKLASLGQYGDVITAPDEVDVLRKISLDAFRVEYETPRTLKESVDLMRMGKSQINANPDGIDLGGTSMELMQVTGIITPEALMDKTSSAYQQGWDIYETMLSATPNYILLKTKGNRRENQIAAGRRWMRLNLATTGMGLALHPVSQALQEYAEMKPHYDAIHEQFAEANETIQMFGRVGYGPTVAFTPRWSIEAKLI
jgi:hypothetical protein